MIVYILFEVLHGVLYPETHDNRIKKKKKKEPRKSITLLLRYTGPQRAPLPV